MITQGIIKRQKQSGFTIVELLIVIVVIGILAAITVVSYTGITQRANTAKAQTNAVAVKNVADAYYAEENVYPTALGHFTSGVATLPAGITFIASGLDATNGDDSIIYIPYGSGVGATIQYWDFSVGSAVTMDVGDVSGTAGTAVTSS